MKNGTRKRSPSPAPLLAAIRREIRERGAALEALERDWLEALLARDLELVRWIANCAALHREQIALARRERASHVRAQVATSF